MWPGTRQLRAARGLIVAGLLAPLGSTLAATPAPNVIAWSTYLRAGPSETASAITELEHDTAVQVQGCSGQWCRVASDLGSGYVDRDALTLPRTPALQPPANTDCVVVGQADNRGPIPTRFCSALPKTH